MSSKSKSRILAMISKIMGFSFREDELSPRLRQEITDVAAQLDRYYESVANLGTIREEASKQGAGGAWLFFSAIIGLVVVVVGVLNGWASNVPAVNIVGGVVICLFILFLSIVMMVTTEDTSGKEEELASYWSNINGRVEELAKDIQNELSALYEAKVRPTVKHIVIDFARIIQAARGRGIILDTIECPHCKGAVRIPTSGEYFKCPYCGKTIHATKIFDKLKDILAPT